MVETGKIGFLVNVECAFQGFWECRLKQCALQNFSYEWNQL